MGTSITINKETIESFIQGDLEAFKIVYLQTKNFVYTVIVRILGNQHDAEDVLHDFYVKIFEKRKEYKKEKSALTTWFYRIAVNMTINYYNKKKDRDFSSTVEATIECDLLEKQISEEEYSELLKALNHIPVIYRTCLILKEVENLSYEEIAKILNINLGTVRSRINRAKKSLTHWYQKGGVLCLKKK